MRVAASLELYNRICLCGCLKSLPVLFHGIEAVVVLTLITPYTIYSVIEDKSEIASPVQACNMRPDAMEPRQRPPQRFWSLEFGRQVDYKTRVLFVIRAIRDERLLPGYKGVFSYLVRNL